MNNLDMFSYIISLSDKYLDRSVYGHNKEKRLKDLAIADRLIKLSGKHLDAYARIS